MRNRYEQYLRHPRRAAGAIAAALLLTVIQPAAPALAEPVFTFEGGGFGHSVGMSQYGAYGMALDGYSWQEIVTHYFTDTQVAEVDPLFREAPLWVGITQEEARVDFLVRSIGPNPVGVTVTSAAGALAALPGETISIEQIGGGRCRVTAPGGTFTGDCAIDFAWDGWEASPTTALELVGCSLPDWNAPGGTVFKPCTYARGTMHVRPDNNTQRVNVALEIGLEDYVLGISESPYGWGSYGGMAALEAQAVAARSYAVHRSVDRGDPASRPWCWCGLYDTPVDQNYVGWGHGTQNWIDAVRNTDGMILTHPSETHQGVPLPIEAFYSSSTFGWTENSEHGFTSYVPYLRSVDDHWSLDPAVGNHSARWTKQFTASSLASRLPGMSTVTGLEVTACSDTGAALEITFTGSGGPKTFTTRQLRGFLGVRSMQIIRAGSPLPDQPACPQPQGEAPPAEDGGPVLLAGHSIDDDSIGDSLGDGDGRAECDEIVETYTSITNLGAPLTGVAATLISQDPYVSVHWNNTTTFPNLARGGTAPNNDDWDLKISPDAPSGHTAGLTMHVVADNGGPWDLDVSLPVSCGRAQASVAVSGTIGVPDLDGNGSPDVATVMQVGRGRHTLVAKDPMTGATTGSVSLPDAAWRVVDLAPVPDGGAKVAVLMTRDDTGVALVAVADLQRGRRSDNVRFGRKGTPVAVTAMSGAGRKGAFAVAFDLGNGRGRIQVKDSDGSPIGKRGVAITPTDMERFDDLGGTALSELAVVGTTSSGKLVAMVIDIDRQMKSIRIELGSNPAVDLATLGLGGVAVDAIAVLTVENGTGLLSVVPVLDPASAREIPLQMAVPVGVETLPSSGSRGHSLAVYGLADAGSPSALVIDPVQGRATGPALSFDSPPVDAAALVGFGPSGTALVVLTAASGAAAVTVRDAATGATLATISLP